METACKIPSSPEEHREMIEGFAEAVRDNGWSVKTFLSTIGSGSFVRLYFFMNDPGVPVIERVGDEAKDIIQNAPAGVSPEDWALEA